MTQLDNEFNAVYDRFMRTNAMRRLLNGSLTVAHYKQILKEIYHYVKVNPQLHSLASVFFRGSDRDMVVTFLRHAIAESGHDQMALDDLAALGDDPRDVPLSNPLPHTMALTSFAYYQISVLNPIGYLGYAYFLEHLPTRGGEEIGAALASIGAPPEALTFLAEHAEVDVAHNALMKRYLDKLVHDDADRAAVVYAMQTTGALYAQMLQGAIDAVDADLGNVEYGVNYPEKERLVVGL
ncbi:MAG: iron-containing redox enzyme family protein [Pseudomonadota bacterium]